MEFEHLVSLEKSEPSSAIRERVNAARTIQNDRFQNTAVTCNANMTSDHLLEWCRVTDAAQALMRNFFEKMGLSARAYDRVLKVARTIADLDHSEDILPKHAAEAIQYRNLDRKYWQKEL